jgi:hypothetical protein
MMGLDFICHPEHSRIGSCLHEPLCLTYFYDITVVSLYIAQGFTYCSWRHEPWHRSKDATLAQEFICHPERW